MNGIKALKPTVAKDPHAISSPTSKSFRLVCPERGGVAGMKLTFSVDGTDMIRETGIVGRNRYSRPLDVRNYKHRMRRKRKSKTLCRPVLVLSL